LEKEFHEYNPLSLDLIGFGDANKPKIKYDTNDFTRYLEQKLDFSGRTDCKYILVGHSMGALLAKELTIKYPEQVMKSFLVSYPFLEKEGALRAYNYFDRKYAMGTWWTKMLCQTEILYKWMFYPYFYLFRYKYRRSYMDAFKHSYHSAHGAINNTIFSDNRENMNAVADKIILINGAKDRSVDTTFASRFRNYRIAEMGHAFFNHERELAEIIMSNIKSLGLKKSGINEKL